MERHVIDVLNDGKSGRFILATTGGPSAAVISERVAANYHTIIDMALRYGRY
jgi:hypothetical protein